MAAWSWRLILIGAVLYFLVQIVARLQFVALPCAVALLLTALLYPMKARLSALGLNSMSATWLTMLAAFAILVGTGVMVGVRANEEFPKLADQVKRTAEEIQTWLVTGPIGLKESQLAQMVSELTDQINQQRSAITGTVVTGATVAIEVLAAIVLILFVAFFLLKDGDRIWSWFLGAFGGTAPRVDRAGRAAWHTLSQYVQGTVIVAAIHGFIIGLVLAIMGVPLWAPLAVLIFLASFIPVVGILFAGGLATLVTFGAKGWLLAVVFLGILIVEQQLENHVLQPLVVGRAVKFHPLAIILVLAVGGILAGVAGAAVAVPIAAVVYRAIPELKADRPELPPVPEPPPWERAADPPEPGPPGSGPAPGGPGTGDQGPGDPGSGGAGTDGAPAAGAAPASGAAPADSAR
ncbi:AI-2E family transporter [Bailinhaonella thermotolerans]|uniref:AI-2E family transporter n=1 Tax=Bailinhaonella thermotolerans TaxID=1070861 RepID=A0A3A4B8V1_9ACTN|nr:AI-2E family transporter [Bailinhaonella thermotolerans]